MYPNPNCIIKRCRLDENPVYKILVVSQNLSDMLILLILNVFNKRQFSFRT